MVHSVPWGNVGDSTIPLKNVALVLNLFLPSFYLMFDTIGCITSKRCG